VPVGETGAAGVDLLDETGHSSSSSQTVGIALTEVQTLVELEEVTVQHSVSYRVVVFQAFGVTEELLEEVELGFGQ
jgi:hypothetical protein